MDKCIRCEQTGHMDIGYKDVDDSFWEDNTKELGILCLECFGILCVWMATKKDK